MSLLTGGRIKVNPIIVMTNHISPKRKSLLLRDRNRKSVKCNAILTDNIAAAEAVSINAMGKLDFSFLRNT